MSHSSRGERQRVKLAKQFLRNHISYRDEGQKRKFPITLETRKKMWKDVTEVHYTTRPLLKYLFNQTVKNHKCI